MMNRKDTVRGCIIINWRASGSSEVVYYEQLLGWAKECCNDFNKRGLDPAPEFIEQMGKGNDQYPEIRQYHQCHHSALPVGMGKPTQKR